MRLAATTGGFIQLLGRHGREDLGAVSNGMPGVRAEAATPWDLSLKGGYYLRIGSDNPTWACRDRILDLTSFKYLRFDGCHPKAV